MQGKWSQTRLCLEANIFDDTLCLVWCVAAGLLRPMAQCLAHEQNRTIFNRQRGGHTQLFWRCSRCRDQISIRLGSIFYNVKLSLGRSLMLVLCFAQGLSIEDARRALRWSSDDQDVAKTTVVRLYDRLRTRIDAHTATMGKIGGPRMVVQIDEALIGRRKYHRGRVVKGTWVLGMIAEDGKVRFEIVQDRKAATLQAVIQRNVARGSIVHTDEWRAYSRLPSLGYSHATVNHSERFVSPDGVHTQRIESQWRQIRRKFSKGGIHHKDIKLYLSEYVWRRGCRLAGVDTFSSIVRILQAE